MNKITTNSFIPLKKTLFVIIVIVTTTAIALIGIGGFKAVHAQQLPQPGLTTSSTEVKPQPKTTATSLPEEQTRQFKNILNGCSIALNAHNPDINKLQSCDQKMSSIRVECDKNQIDHSICDNAKLQDYMNKRGNNNP
jgi:hypothetical protein